MKWAFEWTGGEGTGLWLRCKNTFPTSVTAADAAYNWLCVCVDNDFLIAVRLVKVIEDMGEPMVKRDGKPA